MGPTDLEYKYIIFDSSKPLEKEGNKAEIVIPWICRIESGFKSFNPTPSLFIGGKIKLGHKVACVRHPAKDGQSLN